MSAHPSLKLSLMLVNRFKVPVSAMTEWSSMNPSYNFYQTEGYSNKDDKHTIFIFTVNIDFLIFIIIHGLEVEETIRVVTGTLHAVI